MKRIIALLATLFALSANAQNIAPINGVFNSSGDVTGYINRATGAETAFSPSNITGTVPANKGGTGVANNAAATLTRSGNHGLTLTTTGTTALTLPTSGTLATVSGALGTPSSVTLTNGTGLPVSGITGLGTGVGTALGVNVGSAGAPVLFNGDAGTPSALVGTNITGTAAALSIGGNAATATALAADPTDCSSNQFATGIAASGNLTCAQPAAANISDYSAGQWTPVDTSGASLTFDAGTSGFYTKIGKLVAVTASVNYPATASGATASFGGLPYTVGAAQGNRALCALGTTTLAFNLVGFLNSGGTNVILRVQNDVATGKTNADLTGATLYLSCSYIID